MRSFIYHPPEEVEKNYIESGCSRCPFCSSDDIAGEDMLEFSLEVRCENCGEWWLECFEVVGILLESNYTKHPLVQGD